MTDQPPIYGQPATHNAPQATDAAGHGQIKLDMGGAFENAFALFKRKWLAPWLVIVATWIGMGLVAVVLVFATIASAIDFSLLEQSVENSTFETNAEEIFNVDEVGELGATLATGIGAMVLTLSLMTLIQYAWLITYAREAQTTTGSINGVIGEVFSRLLQWIGTGVLLAVVWIGIVIAAFIPVWLVAAAKFGDFVDEIEQANDDNWSDAAFESVFEGFIDIFLVTGLTFLILIPVMMFFYIRLSMVFPIVAGDRIAYWPAIKRSWDLTRGNFWSTFVVLVLGVWGIAIGASIVTGIIGGLIGEASGLIDVVLQVAMTVYFVYLTWSVYWQLSGNAAAAAAALPAPAEPPMPPQPGPPPGGTTPAGPADAGGTPPPAQPL